MSVVEIDDSRTIREDVSSWGRGFNLAISFTDWMPGGGLADNAVAAGFPILIRYGDKAMEDG